MNDIKDAPWIIRAELYGDPWYTPHDNNDDYDEDYYDDEDYYEEENSKDLKDTYND
jgi:hypothetical protein